MPSTSRTPAYSPSPQDAFVADVLDTPGLSTDMTTAEMIGIGQSICGVIGTPGITRQYLEQELGTVKYGPVVMTMFLNAAEANLCPGKRYLATAPAVPVAPPVAAGPATSMSDGTYEVGIDIVAGKYKTSGSDSCYWSRLRANDGSTDDIIDNELGAGPKIVTVKAGEYFETQDCGTWSQPVV